jgi:hypothetical protein
MSASADMDGMVLAFSPADFGKFIAEKSSNERRSSGCQHQAGVIALSVRTL